MKYSESFTELIRSTKKLFKSKGSISKEVKLMFFKTDNYEGKKVISLVIEGIDNEYCQFNDPKPLANWEIYLMSDGTWKIA